MQAMGIRMAPTSPPYHLHTISYRNHRKIMVVDGTIGYLGGMNLGQEHLSGGKGFDSWRDTQVRIAGEGAALLQAIFMVDWYNAVREDLFRTVYFPGEATPPLNGEVPVQILTSGPDSRWAAIRQLYAVMIVSAQRHVRLQSPFFIPDATIAEALRTAALSGVDVKVMLSARPSGNRLPDWAGNTYVADIVKAGVRVFLYEKGYLHAKTISIDSDTCSIGSANIDIRSFSINYELNAVLYSAQIAKRLEGLRPGPRLLHRVRSGRLSEASRRAAIPGLRREAPLSVALMWEGEGDHALDGTADETKKRLHAWR
jgi:cardiolipin synthase